MRLLLAVRALAIEADCFDTMFGDISLYKWLVYALDFGMPAQIFTQVPISHARAYISVSSCLSSLPLVLRGRMCEPCVN
jgi:hypothetical protein